MKRVIVVGSAGQDGRILCERMRAEGHRVVGIETARLEDSESGQVRPFRILDSAAVQSAVERLQPDEIYYLAAFHHPAEAKLENDNELFAKSFEIHVGGLLNFLEAIRRKSVHSRLFYAGSAGVFGVSKAVPQDEDTPFDPDCVYGITKAAGMRCVRFYRQVHCLFAASGILYNHESPYRPPGFVTQKIVQGALAIRSGRSSKLVLGDLNSVVDWGYAADYVDAMVRMLSMPAPADLIVATGEPHTVREFVEATFSRLGLDLTRYVETRSSIISRPPRTLIGNPSRLREATGWKPTVSFAQMIDLLIQAQEQILGIT